MLQDKFSYLILIWPQGVTSFPRSGWLRLAHIWAALLILNLAAGCALRPDDPSVAPVTTQVLVGVTPASVQSAQHTRSASNLTGSDDGTADLTQTPDSAYITPHDTPPYPLQRTPAELPGIEATSPLSQTSAVNHATPEGHHSVDATMPLSIVPVEIMADPTGERIPPDLVAYVVRNDGELSKDIWRAADYFQEARDDSKALFRVPESHYLELPVYSSARFVSAFQFADDGRRVEVLTYDLEALSVSQLTASQEAPFDLATWALGDARFALRMETEDWLAEPGFVIGSAVDSEVRSFFPSLLGSMTAADARLLDMSAYYTVGPVLDPRGELILYPCYDDVCEGATYVVRRIDSGEIMWSTDLPFGDERGKASAWSQDGSHVAIGTWLEEPMIRIFARDGALVSETNLLPYGSASSIIWSGDGSKLAFPIMNWGEIENSYLGILARETGQLSVLALPDVGRFQLSPDGRYLSFRAIEQKGVLDLVTMTVSYYDFIGDWIGWLEPE